MKKLLLSLVCLAGLAGSALAQAAEVRTVHDDRGWKLTVDGQDFPVYGMVWSYTPVGENYTYDLFSQPEDFIQRVIDTDMVLLKAMGVNAIRCFSTIPPVWVEYIYDRYGIYTMVNDLFGRYGVTVDGRWQMPTDYSDPATRRTLLAQAEKTFRTYKDTRGVLMYMLGNESNYGLEWTSAAIENLPGGEQADFKAKALYSLFQEAFVLGKKIDTNHPMGLVNGDLQYLRVMKDLVPDLDILGVNTYRGAQSFDGFYQSIAKDLGRPFVYTEFGADAYNVATEQEDQDNQARLVMSQWKELYGQAWGKGKSANCLGGFVFEWMDEWWKAGMESGLTVHDTNGTWSNGGYSFDAVPGRNNMNEEWFGIVGQSLKTVDGVPRRLPRTTYFLLQDLWRLDLYTSTKEDISKKFALADFGAASRQGNALQLRDNTTDPMPAFVPHGSVTSRTWLKGHDQGWKLKGKDSLTPVTMNTLTGGFDVRGPEGLTGSFTFRLLPPANVLNPSVDHPDPVELSAKVANAVNADGTKTYARPFELYKATIDYKSPGLTATLHYHDGHADWAAEGDFFGLLPESFDLFSPDKEGSKTPFGVEITLPEAVPGLKIYGGPELFWGAQPRVMAKYSRAFGWFGINLVHDEEYGVKADAETWAARSSDRWTSASVDLNFPRMVRVEAGGMLAQYNRINNADHTYAKVSGGAVESGLTFGWADALAAKVKVTTDVVPYLKATFQYLYAGPLADTRAALPREGSQLFDVGTGNRQEFLGTLQGTYGDWVLRTSVLARQPLLAPLNDASLGATLRNPLSDEFFVWQNRQALQGEAVLTWDRTGATYFHDWNNVDREDSPLSASLGLLYDFVQGPTDAYQFRLANGTLSFFDAGLPEVKGTWSLQSRVAGRPFPGTKVALSATAGKMQSIGKDPRLVQFWRVGGQASWGRVIVEASYAKDAWGPFGWDREFNITYPVQWSVGVAWALKPVSFLTDTDRIGLRFASRDLDSYAVPAELSEGSYTNIKNRFTAELYAGWSF